MGVISRATASLAAATVAGVGYGWAYERKAFQLREATVPVLPADAPALRILHLSDLHITPNQPWKVDWVSGLARLQPDFVVDTGDNLASLHGIPEVLAAMGPLLDVPGAFVPGSNDWFAPQPKNPTRYLLHRAAEQIHGETLPWGELRTAFTDAGWLDLTHRRTTISLRGLTVELAGVSDPHLKADHYDRVAGAVSPEADLAIGLSHTPEPRVIDCFAADGFDLVMSGHTHGGQLRLPGYGAIITNCGLERSRARGLSAWGSDGAWLHVSAGLGTSPYAPVRFACHPEATLLTLVPRPGGRGDG